MSNHQLVEPANRIPSIIKIFMLTCCKT